MSKIWSESTQ